MLDSDLAELYGVEVRRLNEQASHIEMSIIKPDPAVFLMKIYERIAHNVQSKKPITPTPLYQNQRMKTPGRSSVR